jgi:hypothetical protein
MRKSSSDAHRRALWRRWRLEVMTIIVRMRPLVVAASVSLAGLPSADLLAQTPPPPTIVPQVTPRLNEPGSQLTIPQPGSPAQQPSSPGAGSSIAPSQSATSLHRPSSHRVGRHRHVSRTHAGRKRHAVSAKGGTCSYESCIKQCFASGVQAVNLSRRGNSSCADICKHKGCG